MPKLHRLVEGQFLPTALDLNPALKQTGTSLLTRAKGKTVRQSSGLLACSIFLLVNIAGLVTYNQSQAHNFWHSPNVTEACLTGNFDTKKCLKDWTLFMWALQNGFERTLDARRNRLTNVNDPDVYMFGSSLMIFPLWFADHGDNLPDSAYYNLRSEALEKKCAQAGKIFNVSLALMSASDASRVVDRYFDGVHRPKVLVYGVGPRDFYDAFVSSPSASVYFNQLSNFDDYTKNASNYFPSADTEAMSIGKRMYFMYDKHQDLLSFGKTLIKELAHKNPPSTVEPLTNMGPKRNLDEYKGHYKNISAKAFDQQMGFLKELLQTCSKRNIHVILVGMPLTTENRALLPAHVHEAFTQKLSTLAIANGQKFVDFNGSEFHTSDFLDSAHLNAAGAHKLIDRLAPIIDAEMKDVRTQSVTR
ncbi:MAG: hypothetical protein JST89_16855 [Cyanobacteria bacterium SZAS-4]|nr:hypothetical protein [Cyanobacteria bacterium SZAS-4]